MHKIFWVSLSAAILAARLSGAAETAYGSDIDQIEELVEEGNWVELRGFLRDRPELTERDDPFSRELQNFLGQTSSLYSALIIDQVKFPNIQTARIASVEPTRAEIAKKPPAKDADLLLEAELAALKGGPEIEVKVEIYKGEADPDPLLKHVTRSLTEPQEPNQNIETASLNVGDDGGTFDESGVQEIAALGEPDRAVTSARDVPSAAPPGPSIY